MNRRLIVTAIIVLLSLLGGISGATAGQLAQAPDDQKGPPPPQQGPAQIRLESSPLAAVGSGFTYQGRLVIGGSPANGDYDFTFSLFDAATGGNQIGSTISVLTQTLSIGTFSAVLDFGPSAFQGDARWLQISVRPSGDPTYTDPVAQASADTCPLCTQPQAGSRHQWHYCFSPSVHNQHHNKRYRQRRLTSHN